jgi:hypothetical protein
LRPGWDLAFSELERLGAEGGMSLVENHGLIRYISLLKISCWSPFNWGLMWSKELMSLNFNFKVIRYENSLEFLEGKRDVLRRFINRIITSGWWEEMMTKNYKNWTTR